MRKPKREGDGPHPTLILLHGRGANEDDLLGLAEYLDERLLIISPRAPYPFQHGGGFTWYDLEDLARPEPAMFAESHEKLSKFVADVREAYHIDKMNMFVGGFSMGTMMSYTLSLTHPAWVKGVLAMSGYVPEGTAMNFLWDEINGKPFFVAHGKFDPVIPVAFGQRAKELLENAHANVTYREYDMGHQIGEECLNDMMKWLTAHI